MSNDAGDVELSESKRVNALQVPNAAGGGKRSTDMPCDKAVVEFVVSPGMPASVASSLQSERESPETVARLTRQREAFGVKRHRS